MNLSHHKPWPVALAALTLAAGAMAQPAGAPVGNPGSDQLSQGMKSGMQAMSQMTMTGDLDKDFAMMMKMHHQQAVDMARIEVEHGKSPQIKAMANKMMKDQKKEIEQLDAWLEKQP